MSPPPIHAPEATLTRDGVVEGARMAIPFFLSSIIYGVAFGLLASESGLSALEAVLMSVLVFSGTAQIAVLQIWGSLPGLLPVFLIVLVANVRYLLMGASLRPWLGSLSALKANAPLWFMVDGGFALGTRSYASGNGDAGVLLGASLISYVGWSLGTALGTISGKLIANPKAIGLDFIVIAFCAATVALMARTVRDFVPPAAALVAIVVADRLMPGPWVVVIAGLTAAIVAALRYRPATTGGTS